MARLNNRYQIPSIPIVYVDPQTGHRIHFRPATETFYNWRDRVWAYADGNGKPRPTEDTLDEIVCAQVPRSYCNGQANTQPQVVAVSTGCRSCGGRR